MSLCSVFSQVPTDGAVTVEWPAPITGPLAALSEVLCSCLALFDTAPEATRFIIVEKECAPDTLWESNAGFLEGVSAVYADTTVAEVGAVIFECSG